MCFNLLSVIYFQYEAESAANIGLHMPFNADLNYLANPAMIYRYMRGHKMVSYDTMKYICSLQPHLLNLCMLLLFYWNTFLSVYYLIGLVWSCISVTHLFHVNPLNKTIWNHKPYNKSLQNWSIDYILINNEEALTPPLCIATSVVVMCFLSWLSQGTKYFNRSEKKKKTKADWRNTKGTVEKCSTCCQVHLCWVACLGWPNTALYWLGTKTRQN